MGKHGRPATKVVLVESAPIEALAPKNLPVRYATAK